MVTGKESPSPSGATEAGAAQAQVDGVVRFSRVWLTKQTPYYIEIARLPILLLAVGLAAGQDKERPANGARHGIFPYCRHEHLDCSGIDGFVSSLSVLMCDELKLWSP